MAPASGVAVAATFVWLGMVLAISFLEAPLKFRAPGVTLPIGLGIGRLVFRALNVAEGLLATVLAVGVLIGPSSAGAAVSALAAVGVLAVQVGALRPRLTRRSDRVVAGDQGGRSRSHHLYIALEVLKVGILILAGTLLLMG
jgi:hypothetical protein